MASNLTVAAPGEASFTVAIVRSGGFTGTVAIDAVDPPTGVTIGAVEIPEGSSGANLSVEVSSAAAVQTRSVTIRGEGAGVASVSTVLTLQTIRGPLEVAVHLEALNDVGLDGVALRVTPSSGDQAVGILPDGGDRVEVLLPNPSAAEGLVADLLLDASSEDSRAFLPSLITGREVRFGEGALRAIMIPQRWTIRSGTYQGQEVDVDLALAQFGDGRQPSPGAFPYFPIYPGLFPATQEPPIPLVYWENHPSLSDFPDDVGELEPAEADAVTASFRAAVDDLNDRLGQTWFELQEPDEVQLDSIRVTLAGKTRWLTHPKGGIVITTANLRADEQREFPKTAFAAGDRWVQLPGRTLGIARVVHHELLHTQGLGHTCYFQSALRDHCFYVDEDGEIESYINDNGIPSNYASPADVVLVQLRHAVARLGDAENFPDFALYEALRGQLELLGLDPAAVLSPQPSRGSRLIVVK
ncbi:MAG: hypothetical protein HKN72_08140 [Gemmatimonadetes bacterium]|nr:hypothetical protein [Gemmatimonadota bacterium]